MTRALAFWILMLLWLVFGIAERMGWVGAPYGLLGGIVMLFILFGLLGWQVFGPPLR
jgi:cell shape-determining protein MreD